MGKTYATAHYGDRYRLRDSDSSEFHFLEGLDGKTLNPGWPKNYLDHIASIVKSCEYQVLFVSTHEEVRRGLHALGIPYILVIPHKHPSVKTEFLKRYRERGSSEKFVKLLDENWNAWTGYEPEKEMSGSRIMFNDDHIDGEFLGRLIDSPFC